MRVAIPVCPVFSLRWLFESSRNLSHLRLRLARWIITICLIWPFLNTNYFFNATFETNFLPIFVAALLMPEALLNDKRSLLLVLAVILMSAVIQPNGSGYLRLAIALLPILFIFNVYRISEGRNEELVNSKTAYRTLFVFVGFCVVQYIHFNLSAIVPEWVTQFLQTVVPRYMGAPYDDSGIRGVQGWASEPSGAALMCLGLATVVIQQDPRKRTSVLLLFALLTVLNKSIYCLLFLVFLGFVHLTNLKRARYSIVFVVLIFPIGAWYLSTSARVNEFRQSTARYGLDETSNRELQRVAQIILPVTSFPKLYSPVTLFGITRIEPIGLFPLLVGYGSVLGFIVYYRLVFQLLRLRDASSWPMALCGILVLSFLAPPNFVPSIVGFVYALNPKHQVQSL
jgi:hypothetical protein